MSNNVENATSQTTELALLGFLRDGPRHGYAIYRELSQVNDMWLIWRMKQSQLYAILTRFEEKGLLSSFREESIQGRPPRKMYQLTKRGIAAFASWLTLPVERGRQFRLDLLIKLFFAQRDGKETLTKLLRAQKATCVRWLEDAALSEQQEKEPFGQLVHRYRSGQIQAMLNWLDECQETLVASPLA